MLCIITSLSTNKGFEDVSVLDFIYIKAKQETTTDWFYTVGIAINEAKLRSKVFRLGIIWVSKVFFEPNIKLQCLDLVNNIISTTWKVSCCSYNAVNFGDTIETEQYVITKRY